MDKSQPSLSLNHKWSTQYSDSNIIDCRVLKKNRKLGEVNSIIKRWDFKKLDTKKKTKNLQTAV